MDKRYVLDTSAFFTLTRNEKGSETVERVLLEAKHKRAEVFVSFISFMEVYYTVYQSFGEDAAKETIALMNTLPIEKIHSTDVLSLMAGRLKAKHRLSVADAFVAATAIAKKATLVHKDPEFIPLAQDINILALPYKN